MLVRFCKKNNLSSSLHSFSLILLFLFVVLAKCSIYYVDPDITLSGNGKSWMQAIQTLDEALLKANKPIDQIWLKGGYKYIPMSGDRSSCFVATIESIKIYGGFNGNEDTLEQRPNFYYNESILSGDINEHDAPYDNCYHVLTFTAEITLDRITIQDGNADYQAVNDYLLTTQIDGRFIDRYGGAIVAQERSDGKKLGLYLNEVTFLNNIAINGGALWIKGNDGKPIDIVITNCIFQHNDAINGKYEGGYGGAIYSYLPTTISIENTMFVGNYAKFRGGAIYLDYGGHLSCDGCIFDYNFVDGYGGAVFSEDRNSQTDGTVLLFTDCEFVNNYAGHYGGAVTLFNQAQIRLENNEFNSNVAGTIGGALALINAHNNTFSTMHKNWYMHSSDDIYRENDFLYNEIDHDLSFDMKKELSNMYQLYEKIRGEELDVLEQYQPKPNVCYVNVNNKFHTYDGLSWHTAYQDLQRCIDDMFNVYGGGEIWVAAGTYVPTRVPQWKIVNKKTSAIHKSFELFPHISIYGGFGGTEQSRGGRNFHENPTYLSCKLDAEKKCTQILLAAQNTLLDGFVFIESGFGIHVSSDVLKSEWSTSPSASRNSLTVDKILCSSAGNSGGGVYSNHTDIVIVNSIFYKLFASGKGGAMYCIGESTNYLDHPESDNSKSPVLVNVKFIGNRASERGGAISADVDCNFVCKYCTFDSNSCSKKGGAIYLDFYSSPAISNSGFKNNYALESGGCIAADGGSLVSFSSHTSFINNSALWEGACLYSGSGVDLYTYGSNLQGFFFDETPIFTDNEIRNMSSKHNYNIGIGQNKIYTWPYTIVESPISSLTTTPQPTERPTKSPITDYSNIEKPNFLLYVVDDMVYTEEFKEYAPKGTVLNNNYIVNYPEMPTPYLHSFMKESVVFTRAYPGGPKCSPSRFSLLTGRQACRSEWAKYRTLETSSGIQGTNTTVLVCKLQGNDNKNNIAYQLKFNSKNSYYTGMVGKWHLMTGDDNGDNIGCNTLIRQPNAELYGQCANIVKQSGFDFVDAFYISNIADNQYFTHNPEWMVSESIKFIDTAINIEKKNFFLYFASTLTHSPSAEIALRNFTDRHSPKGILTGNDIPIDTGMWSRDTVWENTVKYCPGTPAQFAGRYQQTASYLWMDQQFGALINYLKDNDLYDNTFIIVTNDHGMAAKGTLYEQGSRVLQIVRYPPLFQPENGPHVINEDLIVSHVDNAAIIFDLAKININKKQYILDGKNWIDEVATQITEKNKRRKSNNNYKNGGCCREKFMDICNSHSLITTRYKYIFRATKQVETDNNVDQLYANTYDNEQLYDLQKDPSEQNNIISSRKMSKKACYFKDMMANYINNVACSIGSLNNCTLPNMNKCSESYTQSEDESTQSTQSPSDFDYKSVLTAFIKSLL